MLIFCTDRSIAIRGADMNEINSLLEVLGSVQLGIGSLILIAVVILILMIILCLPIVFVLRSTRVSGGTKVIWFILTSLFSWLAYPFFLALTRKKEHGDPRAGDISE